MGRKSTDDMLSSNLNSPCDGEKSHTRNFRHFQARQGVSPSAIAWKNQVWDLINLGVSVVGISPYPLLFLQLLIFWGLLLWYPILLGFSVWMKHFQQDHALSPQTACAPPVWKNPDCGLVLRKFRQDLLVFGGQGRWWGTSEPLIVLRLSWDDAFVEEGVKNAGKK